MSGKMKGEGLASQIIDVNLAALGIGTVLITAFVFAKLASFEEQPPAPRFCTIALSDQSLECSLGVLALIDGKVIDHRSRDERLMIRPFGSLPLSSAFVDSRKRWYVELRGEYSKTDHLIIFLADLKEDVVRPISITVNGQMNREVKFAPNQQFRFIEIDHLFNDLQTSQASDLPFDFSEGFRTTSVDCLVEEQWETNKIEVTLGDNYIDKHFESQDGNVWGRLTSMLRKRELDKLPRNEEPNIVMSFQSNRDFYHSYGGDARFLMESYDEQIDTRCVAKLDVLDAFSGITDYRKDLNCHHRWHVLVQGGMPSQDGNKLLFVQKVNSAPLINDCAFILGGDRTLPVYLTPSVHNDLTMDFPKPPTKETVRWISKEVLAKIKNCRWVAIGDTGWIECRTDTTQGLVYCARNSIVPAIDDRKIAFSPVPDFLIGAHSLSKAGLFMNPESIDKDRTLLKVMLYLSRPEDWPRLGVRQHPKLWLANGEEGND